MTNTGRTALIIVWIGPLPSYFPLWLRSLSANKAFDFLLFTDQPVGQSIPENCRVIRLSFNELRTRIAINIGLPVQIDHPYKLCDFKPAYGEIFNDYLSGYDYWGCCDMDLLFGDLAKFVTPSLLASYKKLFSRGHLTIYRNEPAINSAWRSSGKIDHRKIMTSPEVFLFDEWSGINRVFDELGIPQYNAEVMGDVKVLSSRVVCFNIKNYNPQIFAWNDGRVMQYFIDGDLQSNELAYIHFQKRKINLAGPEVFHSKTLILNPQSILPFDGEITARVVKKYDRPGYSHFLHSHYKRIKKKINSFGENGLAINKDLIHARP